MVERRLPSCLLFHWDGNCRRKCHMQCGFRVMELKLKRIIEIAAGEAKNPRRSLPKAIRGVYIRILL